MRAERFPEARELLHLAYTFGITVPEMPEDWPPASKDRNDDPFLWTAVAGRAEYILSYDRRHMLRLRNFKGIPIGRPRDFFKWAIATHPIRK